MNRYLQYFMERIANSVVLSIKKGVKKTSNKQHTRITKTDAMFSMGRMYSSNKIILHDETKQR